jgi:hypothetical protein
LEVVLQMMSDSWRFPDGKAPVAMPCLWRI